MLPSVVLLTRSNIKICVICFFTPHLMTSWSWIFRIKIHNLDTAPSLKKIIKRFVIFGDCFLDLVGWVEKLSTNQLEEDRWQVAWSREPLFKQFNNKVRNSTAAIKVARFYCLFPHPSWLASGWDIRPPKSCSSNIPLDILIDSLLVVVT